MSSLSAPDLQRAAFEDLVRQVYEPVQRYAARRTDPDTARDVVGDVLLVLWRRLADVPTDDPLPWCYGVARRVLANTRRGAARRLRLVERLTHEPVDEFEVTTADTADRDRALHSALRRLGSADREVLFLWAWEGLEAREIAVVLDITSNAASIRLHRAKSRLREVVDDDAVEDDADLGKNRAPSGQFGVEGSKET